MNGQDACTITFELIDPVGLYAVNDYPLPVPLTMVIPALSGYSFPAGTQCSFTFGVLSSEDLARLSALQGTSGTLTIYIRESGWRRISGVLSWGSNTLILTTQTTQTFLPWVTPI